MKDEFDNFSVSIESDVLCQDFDDVDLYGDEVEENESDALSDSIEFE